MPTVFCKFENGRESGIDASDDSEVVGFVRGLATAARCLDARVWVTTSLPNEGGRDHDKWLSPERWLETET